jgi:DNA-binding response OmpR family regulator
VTTSERSRRHRPESAARPTVLLADDEPQSRWALERSLARHFDVLVAIDGDQAIELFRDHRPDLVLLDVNMPGTSGPAAATAIRAMAPAGTVPIVLISGAGDVQSVVESMSGAVDDFVLKPVTAKFLVAKLGALLRTQALITEAREQREQIEAMQVERELEMRTAQALLERMMRQGEFDAARVRHVVMPSQVFAGDAIFAAATPSGSYRWMLGDVAGHTLSSALVTMPMSMIFYATARKGVPLVESVQTLDAALANLLPVHLFCAAAVCELDRARGTLHVWNGGLPGVTVRRADGTLVRCPPRNLALAILRGESVEPEIERLEVGPGDRIYAYSDGLIESRDQDGAMLGTAAVEAVLAGDGAETIYDRLLGLHQRHEHRRQDDVSLIEVAV